MTAREQILARIEKALQKPTDNPVMKPDFKKPVFKQKDETFLDVLFAENFTKATTTFIYCENLEDFLGKMKLVLEEKSTLNFYVWETYLQQLLSVLPINFIDNDKLFTEQADVGITLCEALVARTGSILVSSSQLAGRRLTVFPHAHIVVAFTKQLVYDIEDGLTYVQQKYKHQFPSMLSLITGPSQTADIEKTLVLGAHGPKELMLFLIDEE
ncbi:MAG: hypothetical protein EAZ55_04855 [Cytophagales bacterium]|nr:MAG: hypothetical protein EAZ55_04855 [Cytophagales bacterium]